MMTVGTGRQTASERREAVLDAAKHEFAVKGLHGTSTDDIARAAGISQPYLFRLFGSKKELYLATAQRGIDDLYEAFARAAAGKHGQEALQAIGAEYDRMLTDRDRLMLMLKCWTSCDEPEIRQAVRTAWRNLVELIEQASGEPTEVVSAFLAHGMLITIFMSMQLIEDPEPWSQRILDASKGAMQK
jgi:AcrR family transcriptional regulator